MMRPPTAPSDLPATLRIFPLVGAILPPRALLPLNIFEPRYLAMVRDAMATDHLIGMIQPRTEETPESAPQLYDVGGVGRITQFAETGDGRFIITLTGIARFRVVEEMRTTTAYRQVTADHRSFATDWAPSAPLAAAERALLESSLRTYLAQQDLSADWDAVSNSDDENLVNTLSMACPFSPSERQALLEAATVSERSHALMTLMALAGADGEETTLQ